MPKTTCNSCGGNLSWKWEDAFDKFGFGDGDGQVMTDIVAFVIRAEGYDVDVNPWGFHNVVITDIRKDGATIIPADTNLGYDDPHHYLPEELIELLDEMLGDDVEVES